jgi:molybdopterin molybdotransferase
MRSLISVDEATHALHAHLGSPAAETVALADAVGRVLVQDVRAERAHPPFHRALADGIAVRWQPVMPALLRVTGAQVAGSHGLVLPQADACIEIAAGAAVPDGCDCVIPIEQLVRTAHGYALADAASPLPGQYIQEQGSECTAGTTVLNAGTRIGPPQMALLAANGVATVDVARLPRLAIATTDDTLLDVATPVQPGRIRRCSDLALMAGLEAADLGHASLHALSEDPDLLGSHLSRLLQTHDVLVLSGGVSMGQRDYLPTTLEGVGVHCVFHGVAQQPGQAMWFGIGATGQRVFALPGNPVAALVCLVRYVRPALLAALGLSVRGCEQVRLASALPAHALTQFVAVRLRRGPTGDCLAQPVAARGNGGITALGGTEGIVELPAGLACEAGESLGLYRW